MSKDKNSLDRFKNFFRGLSKGSHVPRSRSEELTVTEDLENELKSDSPLSTRLKAVNAVIEISQKRRLENFCIEKLWTLLEDLLKPEVSKEARHLVISLFTSLCQSQSEKSGVLRAKFFHFIRNHHIEEDSGPIFELLKALTDNGRDVQYFEEKMGPLILSWMSGGHNNYLMITSGKTAEFLTLLNNFIKFNQSFVDQEVLAGIIGHVCYLACTSGSRTDALECIHVLESIISYGSLPPASLCNFLATLCRTVNIECLCPASWKTVRNLLGTHLGHSGLLVMCEFMETADRTEDFAVIRGAVFFVGVSLWGSKIVRSLKYSPSTVLSSFAAALERKHIYISYEVMLRIQDLVKCNGDTLQSITWDLVLEIIEVVVEDLASKSWKSDLINYNKIVRVVSETLDAIEVIVDSGGFCGALHRFYNVIETSCRYRSESSIEKLLVYKQKNQLVSRNPSWLNHLILFCERHYREESRPNLKVKAIRIIQSVCLTQMETYEEDLIDKIILHYFKNLETEELSVRQTGVSFLVQFLTESTSKKCHDILNTLERIVNRPYEMFQSQPDVHSGTSVSLSSSASSSSSSILVLRENEAVDISLGVNGLISLFQRKIYQTPSSVAISCYKILVRHLSLHYKKISVLDQCSPIRYNIFDCFFKIRANSLYHLGFPKSAQPNHHHDNSNSNSLNSNSNTSAANIRFSPYLAVDHRDGERPDTSSTKSEHHGNSQSESNLNSLVSSSTSSLATIASSSTTINTANTGNHGGGKDGGGGGLNSAGSSSSSLTGQGQGQGQHQTSSSSLSTPSAPTVTYISLTLACKLVVTCLKNEKDWRILELVLKEIPHVLENKALILSKHGNDIDYLATALCHMVTDKAATSTDSLRNIPPKFARFEYQAHIFPILTSLVSYHSHLEPAVQLKIVKCLELGLVTKCSRICILSLSICTLEMKDTMHKLLPEVLLSLSKITPKVNIAIPVLEFLSTLIHLPRIFASFVQDQYMSIFAIALPYTNPFKFNQYTVSLAHHVIAMWFLKCRLSFRRGFVSYIIKGLEANVWAPFEEESRKNALELHNEDSSNRKRSSSLTEQTFKRRERPISGHTGGHGHGHGHGPVGSGIGAGAARNYSGHILDLKPPMDKSLMTFHQELTETCVDLMARYAFADCSALPTRFQSTNFLLSGGHSQTWLVENKIITVTTSGCTQKELRDGLCDKCWLLCRKFLTGQPQGQGIGIGGGQQQGDSTSSSLASISGGETSNNTRELSLIGGGGFGAQRTQSLLESASSSVLQRRRHRSAFASSSPQKSCLQEGLFEDSGGGGVGGAIINSSSSSSSVIMMMNTGEKSKDDLHLDHKIISEARSSSGDLEDDQSSVGGGSGGDRGVGGGGLNFSGLFGQSGIGGGSQLSLKPKAKSEHAYCTCWCQGWAEVHIRRPTGNTSWMMRVQNQLGNQSNSQQLEFPIKELSAMYMNTLFTTLKVDNSLNTEATSSGGSSPTIQQSKATPIIGTTTTNISTAAAAPPPSSLPLSTLSSSSTSSTTTNVVNTSKASGVKPNLKDLNTIDTQALLLRNQQNPNHHPNSKSPPSPLSPTTPRSPPGSPVALAGGSGTGADDEFGPDYGYGGAAGRKNPVRRSNSSPEMCSSWKVPFLNHQREIQEQDEEESPTTSTTATTNTTSTTSTTTTATAKPTCDFKTSNNGSGDNIHPGEQEQQKQHKLKEQQQQQQSNNTPQGTTLNSTNSSSASSTTMSQIETPSSDQMNSSSSSEVEGSNKAKPGSTSPFQQCYDSIPEEIPQINFHRSSSVSNTTSATTGQGQNQGQNVGGGSEDLPPLRRDRMSTISVMTPARRPQGIRRMMSSESSLQKISGGGGSAGSGSGGSGGELGIRSGISPGFIFLQLCAQGIFNTGSGSSRPLHLPSSDKTKKSLTVLDYIPPYETHKIGVVYVGPGEAANETKILQNQYGSARYREFLNGLGKLIKLRQVDPQKTFLGGLSRDGGDGEFATIWVDDVMQVIFHVATLMPNKPSDPNCNNKKCHIGNDYVAIVYNNSEEEYDISTIRGQFLYACVVIQPLDHKTNRVIVKAKPVLADHIGHTEPKIVSDQNLPIMARQWALHSNLASVIFQSMQSPGKDPYASNWLERLRHIKRMRTRILQELPIGSMTEDTLSPEAAHHSNSSGSSSNAALGSNKTVRPFNVDDFTEFV